ncbi:MAG: hypothetical protein FJ278_18095, partial [Planctomycetes bacterium]|nr:hypothetical protein [Planctomycetota bacterium]
MAVQGVALSAGDLVGVWHLDEAAGSVVLDSSPNANDGEVRGATWTQGRFGGGLQFDGVKAHVTIPGVEALAEGTVEAWAKFDRPPSGQVGVVSFCVGYAGKNDIAILGFAPEGGPMNQLAFGICGAGWKTAKSSVVPALGQWYHLAGAWDAKGSRLYVNGSLAAEQTDWKGGLPAHAAILIGAGSWNAHLAATVDEVRIYRRALSDAEVKAHFEKGDYVSTPAQIRPEERKRASGAIVNAGDFYSAASPSSGIQEAVDSLPPSGGTVFVPSGTWLLKRGIHLRNNVSLRGAGPSTVLKRCPQVMSKLTKSAKPGEMEVTVESAKGFEVGGEVGVFDKQQRGWYITHAFVKEVRLPAATSAAQAGENALVLSKPLTKPYEPEKDAGVVNYFPAIVAEQKRNVSVEDLCVDGDLANNPGPVSDFTFAGIHFYATSDLRVTRCTVRNWPSDGIGVQGGTGNVVSGCTVEGCRGHGMHPGTSLRNSVWTDNICRKNTADGIYFCADVRYIVVSNNVCSENGANGIGGIGNGNDKFNVVSSNVCVRNGRHGIQAFEGDNHSIVNNICLSN